MTDFWDKVAYFVRQDLPRAGSRLRVAPNEDADYVPGWELIRPNTPLFILSWTPVDGFVHVGVVVSWREDPDNIF